MSSASDTIPVSTVGGSRNHDLRAEFPLSAANLSVFRRRAMLEGCKWDPQVGDIATLAAFPLVMKQSVWQKLASQAESLTAEAAAAEDEISQRPELLKLLGLPTRLRRALFHDSPATPSAGRVIRFDFHFTARGWRISEANSDVPGGFSEASHLTAMMAEHHPNLSLAGDPAKAWVDALVGAAGTQGVIALLSAPGYMEDYQVTSFLAERLRERGCRTQLAKPEQVLWRDRVAYLDTPGYCGPLDAMIRFYQAEWLSRLPLGTGWEYFFRGGRTLVANPGLALISESKRFPLVWDRLESKLATWRELLPETRNPREVPWASDDGWLLKTAMCNTGDTVSSREWMSPRDWLKTRLAAHLFPGNWIAQRRFESVPVATPDGPRHACIGIYTVNGKAAGAYARMSQKQVIDYAAVDVALLLEDDE